MKVLELCQGKADAVAVGDELHEETEIRLSVVTRKWKEISWNERLLPLQLESCAQIHVYTQGIDSNWKLLKFSQRKLTKSYHIPEHIREKVRERENVVLQRLQVSLTHSRSKAAGNEWWSRMARCAKSLVAIISTYMYMLLLDNLGHYRGETLRPVCSRGIEDRDTVRIIAVLGWAMRCVQETHSFPGLGLTLLKVTMHHSHTSLVGWLRFNWGWRGTRATSRCTSLMKTTHQLIVANGDFV